MGDLMRLDARKGDTDWRVWDVPACRARLPYPRLPPKPGAGGLLSWRVSMSLFFSKDFAAEGVAKPARRRASGETESGASTMSGPERVREMTTAELHNESIPRAGETG